MLFTILIKLRLLIYDYFISYVSAIRDRPRLLFLNRGLSPYFLDEFILRIANPICLHQSEMLEYIEEQECLSEEENKPLNVKKNTDLPF